MAAQNNFRFKRGVRKRQLRDLGCSLSLPLCLTDQRVLNAGMDLSDLTRKHGVKIPPGYSCSVEECSLAMGKLVGYSSLKAADRMHNEVVVFVDSAEKADALVESGIVVNGVLVPVLPF